MKKGKLIGIILLILFLLWIYKSPDAAADFTSSTFSKTMVLADRVFVFVENVTEDW